MQRLAKYQSIACLLLCSSVACEHAPSQPAADKGAPPAANPDENEQRFPGGPVRPQPTVQLEPLDLSTSVGASPLHVLISNLGAPVGADLLDKIAASVQLVTWPELAKVETKVAQVTDAAGRSDEDQFAHIYLQPAQALSDRWYGLYVAALPSGVTWTQFPNEFTTGKAGSRVSRFRVGSQPIVSGIRSYAKTEGKHVVYVDFSERVVPNEAPTISYQAGAAVDCQTAQEATAPSAPEPTKQAAAAGAAAGLTVPKDEGAPSVTSIRLSCAEPVDIAKNLEVELQPDIDSTSGKALSESGQPVHIAVDPTDWVEWGAGGKLFKPAIP